MRKLLFILLLSGVAFFFPSGAQAAIWNLESVPIIIFSRTDGLSDWTISTKGNTYTLGYGGTTLLTGIGKKPTSTTFTFDNGAYDFWLDTDGNLGSHELLLSNGGATLDFLGHNFTEDGTTYYSKSIIDWNVEGKSYEYTFATSHNPDAGAAPVPIPATLLLLGTGLAGLVGIKFFANK